MNRVAFVLGNLARGGAERQALDLAVALRPRGWDAVFLLAERRGEFLPEAADAGFAIVDLRACHFLPKWNPAFWWNCGAVMARIRRAAVANGCSIVQPWSFWEEALAVPAALLTPGVRGIVSCRQNTSAALGGRLHYRVIQRAVNLSVDRIVCVSPAVRDDARRTEGAPERKLAVIPNGVAVDRFVGASRTLRRELAGAWPDDAVVIGMLANFKAQKRQDVFLAAMSLAVREEPTLRAVLAGADLGTEQAARGQAAALGLQGHVRFAGAVSDTTGFLGAVDVLALSSDFEGLPVSLLEGMAAGLPIVATRVAGTESLVLDGASGLLVPPGDAEAFAAAMVRLARSPQERRSFGARGQAEVRASYSIEEAAARYVEAYESLLRP